MIYIQSKLYDSILHYFSYKDAEKGGILIIEEGEITGYMLDYEGEMLLKAYFPSEKLCEKIQIEITQGFDVMFIHSHPDYISAQQNPCCLSSGDIYFAREFLRINDWESIGMVLVVRGQLIYYDVTLETCKKKNIEIYYE